MAAWSDIRKKALDNAVESISTESLKLISLSQEQIKNAIPEGIDQKKFAELMEVIGDATIGNQQKADKIRNISGYAEIAVNLLSYLKP
jgi:hypothetical protein